MSCTKCGTSNTSCGCKDTPYTTAMPVNCQPDSNCPTPSKCSEFVDASCVYLNDGIYDAALPAKTSVEEAIQQLTLMITNPECTDTTTCCQGGGGGGTYTVDNGLTEDPANNFRLGGVLLEDTNISGDANTYNLTLTALNIFSVVNAQDVSLEATNEVKVTAQDFAAYSTADLRLLNLNETLGQLTLDGYYASTGVLYTATPAYALGVDNTGNVLKVPFNTGATGDITADNGLTNNTTSNVRLGGELLQDTQIAGGTALGGPHSLSIGDPGSTDPIDVLTLHANNLELNTPAVTAATAVNNQVFTLIDETTGEGEWKDPLILTTTGIGAATYNLATGTLNIPTPTSSTYTVTNGLTESPSNNFKLGGSLIETTTLNTGSLYKLNITGSRGVSGAEALVEIRNTGTVGINQYGALRVESTGGIFSNVFTAATNSCAAAIKSESGGTNLYGIHAENTASSASQGRAAIFAQSTQSTGPIALIAQTRSTTLPAIRAIKESTLGVTTVQTALSLIAGTPASGGTGPGIGGGTRIAFELQPVTGGAQYFHVNAIESSWENATQATRTSNFKITGVNNAVTVTHLEISGAGIFTLAQGLSNYTDDAAAALGGIPVNGLYRTGSIVKIRVS